MFGQISDTVQSGYKSLLEHLRIRQPCGFDEVLRTELDAVRARRGKERTEAGGSSLRQAHDENMFGVALSGGGIRSATFNLGLLEAMARIGMFSKIDYLSTVSGGGYIGGWLTAWIKRDGQDNVEHALARRRDGAGMREEHDDTVAVDPQPIAHLRDNTNYLTPRVGLTSLDTFVVVATYLRNFILNLLLIGLASTALICFVRAAIELCSTLEQRSLAGFYLAAIASLYGFAGFVTAKQLTRPSLVPTDRTRKRARSTEGTLYRYSHLWIVLPIFVASVMFAQLQREDFESARTWAAWYFGVLWLLLVTAVMWRHLLRPTGGSPAAMRLKTVLLIVLVSVPTAALSWFLSLAFVEILSTLGALYVPAFGGSLVLTGVYAVTILFIGLAGRALTEEQRQWLSRLGAWLIVYSLVWVLLFSLVQFGPRLLSTEIGRSIDWFTLLLIVWPAISAAGAYSGHRLEVYQDTAGVAKRIFMQAAPYVFIVGLLLVNSHLVAWIADSWQEWEWLSRVSDPERLAQLRYGNVLAGLALLGLALLFSWRVDINQFSMHNFYKNRLIRAYLGASNVPRKADPFTGFCRADDIVLSDLRHGERGVDENARPYEGPIPIVNTALNLVGTRQLALQERKANAFAFTPYYFGYEFTDESPQKVEHEGGRVLYRSIRKARFRQTQGYDRTPTLGDGIAISGAAVSPNMGFRTTPGLAFLLTVFNVRLGSWIANPGHGTVTNKLTPRVGLKSMLSELFALTNESTRFVYLSDGGHFENLGLYELVRRRCRYILVSDAGADPEMAFLDLGNAIRKVRADFGIEIEIDVSNLKPDDTGYARGHYAVGLIHYDQVDSDEQPGFLIYIKASLTGYEPADIQGYRREHPTFPHQSTSDQWFTESQFGSYRVLGRYIGESVFRTGGKGALEDQTLEEFFSHIRRASYPASRKIQESFTTHAVKLQALLADLAEHEDLGFLDPQLFPDSYRFRGEERPSASFVSDDPARFRKGFYFCSRLIQLMENVFIDLNLDLEWAHPDNRGWLNLFNHWTSASMLRITWALTAATYGARFQKFCEDHFELHLGEIEAVPHRLEGQTLDEFARSAFADEAITAREMARMTKIAEKLPAALEVGSFWSFRIRIGSEEATTAADDQHYSLQCGFALNDTDGRLVFLRIRDHLRGLGLARRMLLALTRAQGHPVSKAPQARAVYEAVVRYPQRGRYFEILMHSLRSMEIRHEAGDTD